LPNGCGTIFRITPAGTLTTLYSFDSTDGANPAAGLALATNGSLYGTTGYGGANGYGTVFKITPTGTLTTLYSFDSTHGANPDAGLVQATNGLLYGTTTYGGDNGDGTVFNITPGGTLTTVYSFDSTDDANPYAGLVQATNGLLYGTTTYGGGNGDGTVFNITPGGTLTTLHTFTGSDGFAPFAGLIQATDGNLYGTTYEGGAGFAGTVFKITPGGTLTTLYGFDYTGGGAAPYCVLVQGTDGNFYGTTAGGGPNNYGTVFKITPGGTLTTLHTFDGSSDGTYPLGGLALDTNGSFYGTTSGGNGTVFRLSVGLGPFIKTLPISGIVGSAVKILGTNLTGTTNVTFNGTAATFTVVRPSLITATVPVGATTGKVEVTTPRSTLSSNVAFRVRP
jgi:uncharacterized repeat protein (TIGR03803 family)